MRNEMIIFKARPKCPLMAPVILPVIGDLVWRGLLMMAVALGSQPGASTLGMTHGLAAQAGGGGGG